MSATEWLKVILFGSEDVGEVSATDFDVGFTCEACGAEFESELRPGRDATCPECGSEDVARA